MGDGWYVGAAINLVRYVGVGCGSDDRLGLVSFQRVLT